MLGLFGTLNLGARALQTQQQAVEVAGHNLANVNNPAYARQRLAVETAVTTPSAFGPQGTGINAVGIVRLRSTLLDQQITNESSVTGSLEAQQEALQNAQAELGQVIDTQAAQDGAQHGIAEGLNNLFNEFQTLSTNPTSLTERQVVLMKAADLATKFNTVDQRLGDLQGELNRSLDTDISQVNGLLKDIANLNDKIMNAETGQPGVANDLRDLRQQRLEDLAKIVKIDTVEVSSGVNISIAGVSVVDGPAVVDKLESYDAGGGQMLVRTQTGTTPLAVSGGRLQGTIDARDGAVASLRSNLNLLASTLITQVNTIHGAGYSLTGSSNAKFFDGSDASDIKVNASLMGNPALLQVSAVNGAVGDNQVALSLAQLANNGNAALNNQTFSQNYAQTVAALGQSLSSLNNQLEDQTAVSNMLGTQRNSVSGVSLDEEMTDMVKFQKAFQASAKLITTVDELLDTVVNMKR
jgi:flagellar hook-associated protein 1 FlgK